MLPQVLCWRVFKSRQLFQEIQTASGLTKQLVL